MIKKNDIISLEITTNDGIIYTSDEYIIRTLPLVLENVTDSNYEVGISTEFSYKKKCVVISWSEKLYEYCNNIKWSTSRLIIIMKNLKSNILINFNDYRKYFIR